jgi:hypothetical protein
MLRHKFCDLVTVERPATIPRLNIIDDSYARSWDHNLLHWETL